LLVVGQCFFYVTINNIILNTTAFALRGTVSCTRKKLLAILDSWVHLFDFFHLFKGKPVRKTQPLCILKTTFLLNGLE